jgi:hypothetical protein
LDAAGADTSRILALSTVPDGESGERTLSVPEDLPTLKVAIKEVDAGLVIVDPLMAFLSPSLNSHHCGNCKHHDGFLRCAAFPEGIPFAIRSGGLAHIEPLPNDNGIQYGPREYSWQTSSSTCRGH